MPRYIMMCLNLLRIGIDDGDSEIFGSGNGNNIAEPGETVMIYEISRWQPAAQIVL